MMIECNVCNDSRCQELFPRGFYPLARYGLSSCKDDALNISKYPLHIVSCRNCGLVFNNDFTPDSVDYFSDEIQESSIFSDSIKIYIDNSVIFLKNNVDLRGKTVLEIGCGEGYFLSQFKESNCIAYEPSPEGYMAEKLGITVLHEYFSMEKSYDYEYDFPKLVAMRQVLEHIYDPLLFLRNIHEFATTRGNQTYLYIEVPNAYLSIKDYRFYDFYYEHVSYFTVPSLTYIINKAGYKIIECVEDFNDEIIKVLAVSSHAIPNDYASNFSEKMRETRDYVLSKKKDNLKVIGWGSSGNGSSFLNYNNLNSEFISYIIDSDDRKHGKYMPGTGQKVYPPSHILVDKPDVIIIFSQFHREDIRNDIFSIVGDDTDIEIKVF